MFERFTDASRRIVVLAQQQCSELHDVAIRSEHLLLALGAGDDADSAQLLDTAGFAMADAATWTAEHHPEQRSRPSGHIPFTANARQALERAGREADRLGRPRIPPLVLLLGVLSVNSSGAVALLRSNGVDVAALAVEAAQVLSARDDVLDDPAGGKSSRPIARTGWYSYSPVDAASERDLLARALRRYGRHDADCLGSASCSCGLQALLQDLDDKTDDGAG